MTLRLEAVSAADLGAQGDDPRADELDHPAAGLADQVIVLLTGVDVLVERVARAQALAAHQTALDEELEVAIDRGARYRHPAAAQRAEQRAGVEVLVLLEDLLADRPALRRHAQTAGMDEILEDSQFPGSGHGVMGLLRQCLIKEKRFWTASVLIVKR